MTKCKQGCLQQTLKPSPQAMKSSTSFVPNPPLSAAPWEGCQSLACATSLAQSPPLGAEGISLVLARLDEPAQPLLYMAKVPWMQQSKAQLACESSPEHICTLLCPSQPLRGTTGASVPQILEEVGLSDISSW